MATTQGNYSPEGTESQGTGESEGASWSEGIIRLTGFPDKYAGTRTELEYSSLDELAAEIRSADATAKARLPWIKLAQFSGKPSERGSRRYDNAIVTLWGTECDYDGSAISVSIEEAADKLNAAGIEALLYETASSTPEQPRWRVLCWSSRGYAGGADELRELRTRWVARINGALGGILAPESFTLSQAYYFGGIKGKPAIKVLTVVGTRIDLHDDLDAGAIGKNGQGSSTKKTEQPKRAERGPAQSERPGSDAAESDDDARLLQECARRVEGFRRRWGTGTTPAGERGHKLVQWLGDLGTSEGLTPSARMIERVIRQDYPETSIAVIRDMLSRRRAPRGCDVIKDPKPAPKPKTAHTPGHTQRGEAIDAHAAIATMQQTAQEWLSRNSKHEPTLTAIITPAGLGKSTTMDAEQLKAEQHARRLNAGCRTVGDLLAPAPVLGKMAVAVPRHLLAEELQGLNNLERMAAGFPKNPILHGRNADNCKRWELVSKVKQRGFSPGALCQRTLPSGEVQTCPFFDHCPYQANQKAVKDAPNIIIQHAHLTIPWMGSLGLASRTRLWIDEDPSNILRVDECVTAAQLGDLVNDAEIAELSGAGLAGLAGLESLPRLSKDLLTGLAAPGGLCARHLDGWTSGKLRRAARARQAVEDLRRGKLNPSLDDATILEQIERAKTPPKRLVLMILRLADEIAARRKGEIYSLFHDQQTGQIHMRGRVPTDTLPPNLLITDATASPEILAAVFPGYKQELVEITVRRNARITQTNSHVFSRNWLLTEGHLSEVIEWMEQLKSRYSNIVMLTTKSIRRAITGEAAGKLTEFAEFHGVRLGHYGNIRGSDKYKDCDALIILGRQQPVPEEIEKIAKAFWYDTPKALKLCEGANGRKFYEEVQRPYQMRDGTACTGAVQLHPDPRCQAVLAGLRESELIQAIDRARLIWGEPKDVFILCDIPLPGVEINRLVPWYVLRGADRLSQAIAGCVAEGKTALPLTVAYLAATFPQFWKTEKAAEMWLKKSHEIRELRQNPPRSNIRTTGPGRVLVLKYRLPQGGARRWSTALVWGPSPRAAIAEAWGGAEAAVELWRSPWHRPQIVEKLLTPAKTQPWVQPLSFAAMTRPEDGEDSVLLTELAFEPEAKRPLMEGYEA